MKNLMLVLSLIGGLHAATPALAQDASYVGVWDCGVGVFTFTVETYNPGEGYMPITNLEIDAGNYILSFADGYQIGLSSVTETSMQWLSFESGDMFDCTRLHF